MITKKQTRQLKGYLRPQRVYYGNGNDDYIIVTSMSQSIVRSFKIPVMHDKVEDYVLEVYMYCVENQKFYPPQAFMREVKTRYIRYCRKESGVTARGTTPKNGKRFHVSNIYDNEGNNIIEEKYVGDDWEMEYDDEGQAKF